MFTNVLAYLSGILMIPGYLLGLLWHRSHDGWRAARMQLDSLDDSVIDERERGAK